MFVHIFSSNEVRQGLPYLPQSILTLVIKAGYCITLHLALPVIYKWVLLFILTSTFPNTYVGGKS